MQKDDIMAGLKRALERGESQSDAIQSFANAGYTSADITEAANSVFSQQPAIVKPLPKSSDASVPKAPNAAAVAEIPKASTESEIKSKKDVSTKMKIVILVSALLVLLALGISLFYLRIFG